MLGEGRGRREIGIPFITDQERRARESESSEDQVDGRTDQRSQLRTRMKLVNIAKMKKKILEV